MRRLLVLLLCVAMVSCSDTTGPGSGDDPVLIEPDPLEWAPTLHFDGDAAANCYPDQPSVATDGRCILTFNPDAPVFWEGQWSSSNVYRLAYWIWYGWQQECMAGSGSHANDWEHVVLNFTYTTAEEFMIESVTYYQHEGWYTRWQGTPDVHVWVGKNGHGSYHCRCDGVGGVWDPEYCAGGCGYWEDFRNDSSGVQWRPSNLVPLEEAAKIPGPIGDRVKNQDYRDITACFGEGVRLVGTSGCWQNNMFVWPTSQATSWYDAPALFECCDGPLYSTQANSRAIASIYSVHDNVREDRVWTFGSSELPGGPSTCEWTDFLNGWDEGFEYTAPEGYFISGFASYHDNGREDRRWKVKICQQRNMCTSEGVWTGYVNAFDGVLDFDTGGKVIGGISSYHDNGHEDRRWRFLLRDLTARD